MELQQYDETKWITDFSCPFVTRNWYPREDRWEVRNQKKGPAVIFLDIDGVIQPYSSKNRFDYKFEPSLDYISEKFHNDICKKYDPYDFMAAYHDWDPVALGYIRRLAVGENAGIVLHSGWSNYTPFEGLKHMFAYYGMDDFIIDALPYSDGKEESIKWYLDRYPDLQKRYVIIDDDFCLTPKFPWKCVETNNLMTEADYKRAILYMNHTFGFTYENGTLSFLVDGKCAIISKLSLSMDHVLSFDKFVVEKDWNYMEVSSLSLFFSSFERLLNSMSKKLQEGKWTDWYHFIIPKDSISSERTPPLEELLDYRLSRYVGNSNYYPFAYYCEKGVDTYTYSSETSPLPEKIDTAIKEMAPHLLP